MAERDILPNFTKLIKITWTVPLSSCSAERSFSCLRRVKTCSLSIRISLSICSNAKEDNLSCPIIERTQVLTRLKQENERSAEHELRGTVHVIFINFVKFGNISLSAIHFRLIFLFFR